MRGRSVLLHQRSAAFASARKLPPRGRASKTRDDLVVGHFARTPIDSLPGVSNDAVTCLDTLELRSSYSAWTVKDLKWSIPISPSRPVRAVSRVHIACHDPHGGNATLVSSLRFRQSDPLPIAARRRRAAGKLPRPFSSLWLRRRSVDVDVDGHDRVVVEVESPLDTISSRRHRAS